MKGLRFAAAAALGAMIAAGGMLAATAPAGAVVYCRTAGVPPRLRGRVQGPSSSIRPQSSCTPALSSTASGSATRRAA